MSPGYRDTSPRQLVLDAGALIALDRGNRRIMSVLSEAVEHSKAVVVPAGVLAQVWRGGRQARIARLLADPAVEVVALDQAQAKIVGGLCGVTNTSDVVDASVVVCGRTGRSTIVTSDPDDLRRLDPKARIAVV